MVRALAIRFADDPITVLLSTRFRFAGGSIDLLRSITFVVAGLGMIFGLLIVQSLAFISLGSPMRNASNDSIILSKKQIEID